LIAAGELTESRIAESWLVVPAAAALLGWFMGASARLAALILLAVVTIAGFLVHLIP
jgi:hypothetical protein